MKRVGIYCRVSTDEQAKNKEGSVASQIQRLKMKVDEKNASKDGRWGKVVRIYKDEAYSGKNTNRPEFQQMSADIKSKKVDTVMVTELSRLSRSVTDFLNFVKELEDRGCDFICPQYDFDTTSPAGKVFMTIIMALAQFERELTGERIRNNFHARALRGLSNGGTPFLGLDKDPKQSGRFVVNAEEAAVVREIFHLYLESEGLADVAHNLNIRGIRNKSWTDKTGEVHGGKEFDPSAVWRILGNYAYIGKREVNKGNQKLEQTTLKQEERYCVVDACWEGIIEESLFKRVREKLDVNKRPHYKATYEFILSNLLVCDECGRPLCGQSGTGRNGKHFYYGHTKKTDCKIQRYNAQALEKLVKRKLFALVQSELLQNQFIEVVREQVKNRPYCNEDLLKRKVQEIDEVKRKTEKLADLVADDPEASLTKALVTKIRKNEELLERCERDREHLEENLLLSAHDSLEPDFILSGLKN